MKNPIYKTEDKYCLNNKIFCEENQICGCLYVFTTIEFITDISGSQTKNVDLLQKSTKLVDRNIKTKKHKLQTFCSVSIHFSFLLLCFGTKSLFIHVYIQSTIITEFLLYTEVLKIQQYLSRNEFAYEFRVPPSGMSLLRSYFIYWDGRRIYQIFYLHIHFAYFFIFYIIYLFCLSPLKKYTSLGLVSLKKSDCSACRNTYIYIYMQIYTY